MPQFKTLAFDSIGDMARLYFSFDMKKHSGPIKSKEEVVRQVNNYPGAVERLNMLFRRLKNVRAAGMEVVVTGHEDIEKLYLKGGSIPTKGQPPTEPYALKGWADVPGKRAPDELGRAIDNMLHVKRVNGQIVWMAGIDTIGPGCEWCTKDRFNAPAILNGYLPPSYAEIAKLASVNPLCNWRPPYIWLIYGAVGLKKTWSLQSFPRPMRIFDFDRGTVVIPEKNREGIEIIEYDPEESDEYDRFLGDFEECMP